MLKGRVNLIYKILVPALSCSYDLPLRLSVIQSTACLYKIWSKMTNLSPHARQMSHSPSLPQNFRFVYLKSPSASRMGYTYEELEFFFELQIWLPHKSPPPARELELLMANFFGDISDFATSNQPPPPRIGTSHGELFWGHFWFCYLKSTPLPPPKKLNFLRRTLILRRLRYVPNVHRLVFYL